MIILATKRTHTLYALIAGLDGFYSLYHGGAEVFSMHDDKLNELIVLSQGRFCDYDNDDRLTALIENYEIEMEGN